MFSELLSCQLSILYFNKLLLTIHTKASKNYVYVKGEYLSTLQEIKQYLRGQNKVSRNKVLSYCETLNTYVKNKIENNEKVVLHYVKLTNQLSFQTRFPKSGPTYRRQMVNPWHQHCKNNPFQSWDSPVEYPSRESKHEIKEAEGKMFYLTFKENVQGQRHSNIREDA